MNLIRINEFDTNKQEKTVRLNENFDTKTFAYDCQIRVVLIVYNSYKMNEIQCCMLE